MTAPLNVIALISGGKDSLYSILHCVKNGNRVIALANLYPFEPLQSEALRDDGAFGPQKQERATGDIDSFMYQTAGHNLIPLFEAALGLPLYRQAISGSAVNTSKSYYYNRTSDLDASELDDDEEIESMIPLLRIIMRGHPEANAVCSGAIFSDYQRTRIESIALRLGLVPLAYLWQYPKLPKSEGFQLLRDMADVGFDVRIVKVASGGLDETLLWSNLMDPKTQKRIEKAMRRFGGNVLGEGGEYETIVLKGPPPTWKGRLDVDEDHMRSVVETGGNASLAFHPHSGKFMEYETMNMKESYVTPRKITLWDPQFLNLSSRLMLYDGQSPPNSSLLETQPTADDSDGYPISIHPHITRIGQFAYISNLTSASLPPDAKAQMTEINRLILSSLSALKRDSTSIIFTTILLRSVREEFAHVNEVYSRLFHGPNPPARVTVSSPLPEGVLVMLSIIVDVSPEQLHDGLHVQSRSYWAPANIGPYSQATDFPLNKDVSLVHVAGQIPLVPATMMPLPSKGSEPGKGKLSITMQNFQQDACLALQHMWRIGSHMKVSWWCGAIAYVASGSHTISKVEMISNIWRGIHDRDLWDIDENSTEQLDAWDTMHGEHKTFVAQDDGLRGLPDQEYLGERGCQTTCPSIFIVEAHELPRESSIEWQGLGLAQAVIRSTEIKTDGMKIRTCTALDTGFSVSYAAITHEVKDFHGSVALAITALSKSLEHLESIVTVYTTLSIANNDLGAQIIPCKALWVDSNSGIEQLVAGVIIRCQTGEQ